MNEVVQQLKQHAVQHYTEGGWDVIVECYTEDELAALIGDADTLDEAIVAVAPYIDIWSDRQQDAINSSF